MVRQRGVFYFLGSVMLILALAMLLPLPWAFQPGAESWRALLYSAGITAAVGLLLRLLGQSGVELRRRETFLVVTLAWVMAASAGALPYLFSGVLHSFTDAFFEAMSGFTTTGSSVLADVEAVPPAILLWRSLTHWLGGMGIVVLLVAMLSSLGIGALMVMNAEAPGPTVTRLAPQLYKTARMLWLTYVVLTAVLVLIQVCLGVSLFDALNLAFATMATGGFSTRNASLGAFSPAVQWVHILFMYLAGTNFSLFVMSVQGRSLRSLWRDEEFRLYTGITVGFSLATSLVLALQQGTPWLEALRHGTFQVVSVLTTTGYISQDFNQWPAAALALLGLVALVGGCIGSTAGGVKVMRYLVLFKQFQISFARQLQPRVVRHVQVNGRPMSEELVTNTQQFFVLYFMTLGAGYLLFSLAGLDPLSGLTAAVTTLGNIGPGLGAIGAAGNFGSLPVLAKWTGSVLMMLGRLELYTVLVLFSPAFWRPQHVKLRANASQHVPYALSMLKRQFVTGLFKKGAGEASTFVE